DVANEDRGEIRRQPLAAAAREVHRDRVAQREARDTTHVVVMLVRDDDGGELRGREARPLEARFGIREREAAVHQDAGGPALDNQPVTRAAAAERGESEHYLSWS